MPMASGLSVIVTDPGTLRRHLLRLVADIRYHERDVAARILQVEGAVDIGRRGDRGAFDHDRRTDDRRTVSSSTRPEMPVACAHSNDAENTAVTSNSAFREKRLVEKLIHTNFKD